MAQPAAFGGRSTDKTGREYEKVRLDMDGRLFAALPVNKASRLVYVAGNSYFGETGSGPALDETMTPQPTGFGPYIQRAVASARSIMPPGLPSRPHCQASMNDHERSSSGSPRWDISQSTTALISPSVWYRKLPTR